MTNVNLRAYVSSVKLLEAEIEDWVTARCHRLVAEKELVEAGVPPTNHITSIGRREATAKEELRRRLALLTATETNIRAEIDARIEATKATGIDLGLVRVTRDLDLDAVERATLLLCFAQTVGVSTVEPLDRVGPYGLGIGDVSPDLVANFCELGFADRVGLRLYFGAEGRLVREGLVTVDLGHSAFPSDWPSASLRLTNKGFSALTGLQVPADGAEA